MGLASIKGILFFLLLFVSSFLGSIFILFPFIPLNYFAPSIWRTSADRFIGFWLTFPVSLCGYIFGIKFYVSGDALNCSEPALILMNHRTRLDWMFFWNALCKMDPWLLTTEKISLKKSLQYVPGAGWAMQCAAYIFLDRNYMHDAHTISDMVTYYKNSGCIYQILFFPEGTDLTEKTMKRSNEFAKKHGLPMYHFVLHPRTTGFTYMVRSMRKVNYLKKVYDVTVAYSDGIVSSEFEILRYGRLPHAVHFDVRQYDESEVPKDDNELSAWIAKLWLEKEIRLQKFYKNDIGRRGFLPSGEKHVWPIYTTDIGYCCAFLFWVMISCVWIYFAIYFFAIRFFIAIACISYVYWQWRYAGLQNLVLQSCNQ